MGDGLKPAFPCLVGARLWGEKLLFVFPLMIKSPSTGAAEAGHHEFEASLGHVLRLKKRDS